MPRVHVEYATEVTGEAIGPTRGCYSQQLFSCQIVYSIIMVMFRGVCSGYCLPLRGSIVFGSSLDVYMFC
jgi:hypothetical protein